jgi:hypothetical protein
VCFKCARKCDLREPVRQKYGGKKLRTDRILTGQNHKELLLFADGDRPTAGPEAKWLCDGRSSCIGGCLEREAAALPSPCSSRSRTRVTSLMRRVKHSEGRAATRMPKAPSFQRLTHFCLKLARFAPRLITVCVRPAGASPVRRSCKRHRPGWFAPP